METALSDISSMVTDNGYFPYIVEDMKTFTRIMSICEHKKVPRIGIYSIIDLHWVSKKNKWVWNRDIDYWFSTAGSFIYDFCADCSERKNSITCDIKIVPEEYRDETLDLQIKKTDIAYDIKKGTQDPDDHIDVQNRDEKKEISDNCDQKIDRRMNTTIELTKKEAYYLNKRNLLTSNREIGDWSGTDVEILDKLTFNKDLPIIHISFDKKKERKMDDTDKECFASLTLDLNENQIRYLENNTDDWTWSKQGLSTLLIKLNNIVRTYVYCSRESDKTDKNDVDTDNTSEEVKCLNLEDLNDASSVHIFPSGNAIAKYPLSRKKNLSFIADPELISKIEDKNENGKWRIIKKDGVFHAVKIPDGRIDFEIPKGLDLSGKSIVFGEVGAGKSTLLSSIGNRYVRRHLNVFTIESPRGLHVIDATHLDNTEDAVDIVLLCRPDIVLFDEIRNRKHFQQLKQLSLACAQIIGSFHAGDIFEALTRFAALNGERSYGELSIIADRFIYVKNGKIVNWYTIRTILSSKLSGEFYCDGERPVTEIRDKFGKIVGWLFYFANDVNIVKK
jgi:hypothetical protein